MLDSNRYLELSQKDFELIEAALHTQHKILTVQSKAGGESIRARLSDVTQLMQRLSRGSTNASVTRPESWTQMARSLFC